MGLLDRIRGQRRPQEAAVPVAELAPELVAAAEECLRSGKDVANVTRGKGTAHHMSVAGTAYRPDALNCVAQVAQGDGKLAGVVVREPTNSHDPNAVRVIAAGVAIGYLPALDAKRWQPTLLECEKRGQFLVGTVRLVANDSSAAGPGAVIDLRDGLPGFEGPVSKLRAEEYAKNKAAAAEKARLRAEAAVLLEGDRLTDVITQLQRLEQQEAVRTKQKAGLVAKQVRELLPALRGHSDAVVAASGSDDLPFTESLDNLEDVLEDLLGAEDADEREDVHLEVQAVLEELFMELLKPGAGRS